MNHRIATLLGVMVAVAVLLHGCTVPEKKSVEPVPIAEALTLGDEAFTRWRNHQDADALISAQQHYQRASVVLHDNVNLQKTYYSTLYILSILDWQSWHKQLEQHFDRVNPLIKPELSPPQLPRLNYLIQQKAGLEQQIEVLRTAVSTQPASARAWFLLSAKLKSNRQIELALDSALRAVALEDNSAEFVFHAGDLYDDLARSRPCIYDVPELSKKSLQLLAKAVAIEPQHQHYQYNLAKLYSQLGLYPLALQIAKKTHAIEENQWTAQVLGQAYLDMNQYQQADEQFQKLAATYKQAWANEQRAVIAANNSQWQEARRLLTLMDSEYAQGIYADVLKNWLKSIDQPQGKRQLSVAAKPNNDWELSIKNYINQTEAPSLIDNSSNTCEATEAHFYTALKLWTQGDTQASKANLQEVISLKAYGFSEYIWARALLNSQLFQ